MKGAFADFREQRSGNAAAAVLKIHGKVFDHIAAEGSGGGNFAALRHNGGELRRFVKGKPLLAQKRRQLGKPSTGGG